MLVHSESKELRLRHEFQLRTYTPRQFRRLLDSVPSLEMCDVYDFRYNIEQPSANILLTKCWFKSSMLSSFVSRSNVEEPDQC